MEKRIEEILQRDEDVVGELVELILEYQARAWDKGFGKGSEIVHWWERNPGMSNKENRNPYRKQLDGRR